MDLIPKKPTTLTSKSDDGLGRGMEFAILTALFLGIGYGLDRLFHTKPLFMIILVVVALVGQFASMWYRYDAQMKQHETDRAEKARTGKAVVS